MAMLQVQAHGLGSLDKDHGLGGLVEGLTVQVEGRGASYRSGHAAATLQGRTARAGQVVSSGLVMMGRW